MWRKGSGAGFEQSDTFPELHKMLGHILCGGGKVVRPLLALHSGSLYKYDYDKLVCMASASELMHIATLVHDDAIDKASVRRGRATINSIWGLDRAIIFGDYLFAKASGFAVATAACAWWGFLPKHSKRYLMAS